MHTLMSCVDHYKLVFFVNETQGGAEVDHLLLILRSKAITCSFEGYPISDALFLINIYCSISILFLVIL